MDVSKVCSAAVRVVAAWTAVLFSAFLTARSIDDPAFDDVAARQPVVGVAHGVASAALLASLLIVFCAGALMAVIAVRQAYSRRDRRALVLLATPVAGVALFVGYTIALAQTPDHPVHSVVSVALSVSWLAVGVLLAAFAGVRPAAELLRRTVIRPALARFLGWAAVATTGALWAELLAGMSYGLGVRVDTPDLFYSSNGLLSTPLPITWAILFLISATAVAVATRSAASVLRELGGPEKSLHLRAA